MGNNVVSDTVDFIKSYTHWRPVESDNEYRDREQYKIESLMDIIPYYLHEIDTGLRTDIAQLIISFLVSIDLTPYLSKQLTLDYIVQDLSIYDFDPSECRKKHIKTRAFLMEPLSFSNDEIIVHSPMIDVDEGMDNLDEFETHKHKLPERYKQIISHQQSKYIQSGRKFKRIPPHIFWWKAIEDAFKEYFVKGLDTKDIASYIECNGISELRKHGFLHGCVRGPPLYDTKEMDEQWFIEFFAECVNVEPQENRNSFPFYVIEGKDELVFEMKVVTYSNKKNLGLHMPRYD